MNKHEVIEAIRQDKLLPVIRTGDAGDARQAIGLMREGGIRIFEVTLTVPGAAGIIEELIAEDPQIVAGAGTVLTVDQARSCAAAGARFIVSPIFDRKIVDFCRGEQIAVIPAGLTPTEIFTAYEAGADAVKVFPCGSVGGAGYIKALKSVFPAIPLIPTGGVIMETARDFLDAGAFAVGAGANLVNPAALSEGDLEAVRTKIRGYINATA